MRFLVIMAITAVGCTQQDAVPAEAEDLRAIDALRREHAIAVNERDADRVLAGFTDDVVYLGPDQPPAIGKAALDALIRPIYAQVAPAITMTPQKVTVAGDWAFEWGLLSGMIQPLAGGAPIPVDGKYLYVYERESDGSWLIAQDIYNSNAPPEAQR